MFSDADINPSGFLSCWKSSRSSGEGSTQTDDIDGEDKTVQTKYLQHVKVQTDYGVPNLNATPYNEAHLVEFLTKICPQVEKELDQESHSHAFTALNSGSNRIIDVEIKEHLTLTHNSGEGLKVSEVSWSCTGSVVAAALSHTLHATWCSHPGRVLLYNVDREKPSARVLETPSCVRTVSMHPHLPSVVAAGLITGEVFIWDMTREDSDTLMENVSHTTHGDCVNRVRWLLRHGVATTLVSSSLDGQLFVWRVAPKLGSYHLLARYKSDCIGGISSFSFPPHSQEMFVMALEGGALLHCSFTSDINKVSACDSVEVTDPVVRGFDPQPATITCVEFSPHHDDVFATSSTDQAIRIYSLTQRYAQRVICSVGDVGGLSWYPSQAHMLAGWGGSGFTIYHVLSGNVLITYSVSNTEDKTVISTAAYNNNNLCLLAVGDLLGTVRVWDIRTNTSTMSV